MYAKGTKNYVNFFNDEKRENTEKVVYGRVSEAIKMTGADGKPLMQNGRQVYEYETWSVRLVGKAKQKYDTFPLEDKASIILTEWSARVQYNKDRKQSYPYLLIMDYEVNERRN